MATNSHFRSLANPDEGAPVTFSFDGRTCTAPLGTTVAAALLASGVSTFRSTPVSGAPRAPYCMMGACFDCLVDIDGQPNRQSCMVVVQEGMSVRTQKGARSLGVTHQEVSHAH
ncbi:MULTISPECIES: (2Fe-2S)-binding protein [unclassified Acidovorax]|uniref:(2Fe-2S)-binding protein n=1 Tax=unclassified Acidovorax TaxID=2684926 RepID=UPI000B3FE885|nr:MULTISPECIES: (2Fe-2S)-binding protein [unclassified Acidovorax]MBP3981332.1 (2Fe-2S)-binding protein [Acidovorax sp. JG5]